MKLNHSSCFLVENIRVYRADTPTATPRWEAGGPGSNANTHVGHNAGGIPPCSVPSAPRLLRLCAICAWASGKATPRRILHRRRKQPGRPCFFLRKDRRTSCRETSNLCNLEHFGGWSLRQPSPPLERLRKSPGLRRGPPAWESDAAPDRLARRLFAKPTPPWKAQSRRNLLKARVARVRNAYPE